MPKRKLRRPEEEARISSWSVAEYAPNPPDWSGGKSFKKTLWREKVLKVFVEIKVLKFFVEIHFKKSWWRYISLVYDQPT